MNTRYFRQALSATNLAIVVGISSSCSASSPIKYEPEVIENTSGQEINIDKERVKLSVTDIDKAVLANFLMQFDNKRKPDYSMGDLERNIILLYNKSGPFNCTLIDEAGYFITVNHFFGEKVEDSYVIANNGERFGIERVLISSNFGNYDFLLGKIRIERRLPVTPLLYSVSRDNYQEIICVPSPLHPEVGKVHGKLIEGLEFFDWRFGTNLRTKSGHSGSLIVSPDLRVIGIHQLTQAPQNGDSYSFELKTDYIKGLIRLALK